MIRRDEISPNCRVTTSPLLAAREGGRALDLAGLPQIDRVQLPPRTAPRLDGAELANPEPRALPRTALCHARRDLLEQFQPFSARAVFEIVNPVALPPGAPGSRRPAPTGRDVRTRSELSSPGASASQLLWRGPTSRVRASSASAPHLPDADRPAHATSDGQTRDLPGSDAIPLHVMWPVTPAGRQHLVGAAQCCGHFDAE